MIRDPTNTPALPGGLPFDATQLSFSQSPVASAGSVAAKLQQIISVKDAPYNAVGDGVTDDTAGDQAALTANLNVSFPGGNYKLTSALSLVLYQQVLGAGRSDYLYNVAPSSSNVAGTRLIQTGSAPVFTMGSPASAANYAGRIKITDMVLQGVSNATVNGTEGVKCIGSQSLTLERVQASFFLNAGFRLGASIDANLLNCIATYSQDTGLDLTYDADYTPSSYNAYNCLVLGGQYLQCKNANIRLGTSSFGVRIIGADIESAGNFYSAGTGYGVHVTGEAKACSIKDSWLEGNKIHIVLGPTTLTTTVPVGFVIEGNQFGAVTGGAEHIRINSAIRTVIRNNNFPSGAPIYLGPYAGNPIVENNTGNPKFTNADADNIAYNNADVANDFPTPAISAWSLSNCTVALDTTVTSPGGVIAVYKVTPSATGVVAMTFVGAGLAPFAAGAHHTFGTWIKRSVPTEQIIGWQLSTSGVPKTYSDYATIDTHEYTDEWNWISIGRSIPSTDTGNFQLALVTTVATTDYFYLTAMQSKPGIINVPFPPLANGVAIPRTGTSATDIIVASDSAFIANRAGTITLTLESAAANPGKQLTVRTIQAQTVVSAASNVVPLAGGAAGTAILAATAGKWAILQSDGTNYQIMASN